MVKEEGYSPRQWVYEKIISHWMFDAVILTFIVANSIFMAMNSPKVEAEKGTLWKVNQFMDTVFLIVFFTEMLMKFFALGFFREGNSAARPPIPAGYFRDNWNVLDFISVCTSVIQLFVTGQNWSVIRVLRVLRPLRSIKRIPGMRIIIGTLLKSMGELLSVLFLLAFLFIIYGIIGVQLFNGVLHYRCFEVFANGTLVMMQKEEIDDTCLLPADKCNITYTWEEQDESEHELVVCNPEALNNDNGFSGYQCPERCSSIKDKLKCTVVCSWDYETGVCTTGSDIGIGYQCLKEAYGKEVSNPDATLSSYDNIGDAFLSIFYVVSLDNWSFIMYKTMNATSGTAWFYYISVIFFVSFFGMNLFLAVISDEYGAASDEVENENDEEIRNTCDGDSSADEIPTAVINLPKIFKNNKAVRAELIELAKVKGPETTTEDWVNWMDVEMQVDAIIKVALEEYREKVLSYREGHWIQVKAFDICDSIYFQTAIILFIVINTLLLAIEHHGMSDSLAYHLNLGNAILTIIFALEMCLKIVGYLPRGYIKDPFNVFDGVIVLASLLEFIPNNSAAGGGISALRTFRLLRVFKMVKSIKSLRRLMVTVLESLENVGYMILLLCLFIFITGIMGMQLFGGKLDDIDLSFDDFVDSIVNIFIVLTGDAWTDMMFDVFSTTGTVTCLIFFIFLVLFGAYIIMNLFVAILLERFENQDENEVLLNDRKDKAFNCLRQGKIPEEVKEILLTCYRTDQAIMDEKKKKAMHEMEMRRKMFIDVSVPETDALCIFSPDNPVRLVCVRIIHHPWFEPFIILLILINCGFLAYENPYITESDIKILIVADHVFAILFFIEMVLKLIALGGWKAKKAYFRSGWNKLDAFVVFVSLLALLLPIQIKPLRSMRAIRPLRIVIRSKQIKVVLESLLRAIPAIANVFLLVMFFLLIFCILGVNMFGGMFYTCFPEQYSYRDLEHCKGVDPISGEELRWVTQPLNFDDVIQAMNTLFQVATMSGWADIMYAAVNASPYEMAPEEDRNKWAIGYFLIFISICSFFALNLFVGVVIDNFQRLKSEMEGSAFMTTEQQQWVNQQKLIARIPLTRQYVPPTNPIRKRALDLVDNDLFEICIMLIIFLNIIFMMIQSYGQSAATTYTLEIANWIFILVFTLEAILKIMGYGFYVYWSQAWNKFDFTIVIISLPMILGANLGTSVIRVFRVGRIFKLIKRAKSLQKYFQTLVYSLPSLWNLAFLMLVVFFIYAVLGVGMFGHIQDNDFGLQQHANFQNIGNALLSLFRVATGDAWEELRTGTDITLDMDPECEIKNTCGPQMSRTFFISFIIFGTLCMLELFLAVILENFGNADDEQEFGGLLREMLLWRDVWKIYDPLSTGFVPVFAFEYLMSEVPPPFGLGGPTSRYKLMKFFLRINVPCHLKKLTRRDLILRNTMITRCKMITPVKRTFSRKRSTILFDKKTFDDKEPNRIYCVNFTETLMTLAKKVSSFNVQLDFGYNDKEKYMLHEWYAVKHIQDAWRSKVAIIRKKRRSLITIAKRENTKVKFVNEVERVQQSKIP